MPKGVYERPLSPDERFDRQVDQSGECHLWKGPLASTGYANFWVEGKYIGAHVYAWTRVHGPLAAGQVVRHGPCHNRHCVRLEHLSVGTKGDNNRDRERDGTQKRSLTDEQVIEAKRLNALGVPLARIARDFGVKVDTLRSAVRHRHGIYRHLKD